LIGGENEGKGEGRVKQRSESESQGEVGAQGHTGLSQPPAWIETVDPREAEGRLAELYAKVVDPSLNQVDHIMQVHALHPAGLEAHYALYRAAMRPTASLRKAEREMIALVVSGINRCHY
jgi:alkylhydroperoxidase family enzyme